MRKVVAFGDKPRGLVAGHQGQKVSFGLDLASGDIAVSDGGEDAVRLADPGLVALGRARPGGWAKQTTEPKAAGILANAAARSRTLTAGPSPNTIESIGGWAWRIERLVEPTSLRGLRAL